MFKLQIKLVIQKCELIIFSQISIFCEIISNPKRLRWVKIGDLNFQDFRETLNFGSYIYTYTYTNITLFMTGKV